METTIIIPAYNEQETIAKTIRDIKSLGLDCHIMIVDDGSEDETAKLARQAGAEVVSHPYNKGYGASLKTGIRNAKSEVIVLFDADSQHDTRDIPKLLERMGEYDMVIGDRGKALKKPFHRLPGKWLLGKVAGFLVGHEIPDVNSGFRIVRKDKAEKFFNILPNGFSFSTTITLAFYKEGYNVCFVPVTTSERVHGGSEVRFLRDGAKTLLLMARVIVLFNPLKVFAPVASVIIAAGLVYALLSVVTVFDIPDGAIFAILLGILLLFFGILADQISSIRR